MTKAHLTALKTSAALWVIWGLVHAFAGILVIGAGTADGFAAIADAIDPSDLPHDYHAAVGGIL